MMIGKLLEKIRHWQSDRDVIVELMSRSDRELSDIGLYRGDVVRAVKGALRATEG